MNPVILYDNILKAGILTVTSEASNYSKDNLIDYRSFSKWKAANTSTQNIDINLGEQYLKMEGTGAGFLNLETGGQIILESGGIGAQTPDAIGIYNHNLGTIGATIKVQYLSGTYQTLKTITPTDDGPILETWTAQSAAKYRIEISGMSAAPEIAVIFLGVKLLMADPPDAPYVPLEEAIKAVSEVSRAGHILGSVIEHYPLTINPSWTKAPNLTRTWYITNFIPFWDNHAKKIYPFFYAWDLTNRPDDIYYVSIDPAMVRRESLSMLTYSDELQLQLRGVAL